MKMRRSFLSRSMRTMRPYSPGSTPPGSVARLAAGAVEAEGRRRAAVFQRAAEATVGFEALEGHRANLAGLGADAGHPAALVVDDDIGAVGEERPRDRLLRVIVRLLLLGLPGPRPCRFARLGVVRRAILTPSIKPLQ